ncbi:MAG: winged helix-turn-helix transcriptional regulator [Chitinophagaceae bacterium]|nr:winged helix-turn-helix transcriptional regulator [Oligoflexus sp.]
MKAFDHPKVEDISLSTVLSALGDPIRLSIVTQLTLNEGEIGWGAIEVAVGKATLSHHMKTLRNAGLIHHRKDGTRCFVALRFDVNVLFPGVLESILHAAAQTSSASAPIMT